jgi:transposase-like protein
MERSRPTQVSDLSTLSGFEVIDTILRESEAGETIAALSEKYNVPPSVIYQWRALFLPAFKHQQQLKELEEENVRLRQFITDAMADGIAAKAHILSQITSNIKERIRPRGAQNERLRSSEHPNSNDIEALDESNLLDPVDPK